MTYKTFSGARKALDKGETSCEALVSSFLERIERDNGRLNIFISVDAEGALRRARELDAERARGHLRPLTGMVMAIKDVICIEGQRVTCGSRILENFESLYSATAVQRLHEAGAIFIGKTNCDEFAMGSSNENSHFGPTRNPRNPEYVPGGSSGGSAAAVAAEMCHTSLGSDTGGSIRQPAAFCGVVGLKPTYGRVSRYGLVAYASSFDCMGPFAHTVEDAAAVLEVIAGRDKWDSTSAPVPVPNYREALSASVAGLRVGLPQQYFAEGLDPQIRAMIEDQVALLKDAGAHIEEVSLPHTDYGIATYYILATAEASSNLARYDGVRFGYRADLKEVRRSLEVERLALQDAIAAAQADGDDTSLLQLQDKLNAQDSSLGRLYAQTRTEGFGEEVKRRIMLGTYVLSSGYYDAYYAKAQRVRTLIRRDFDHAFEKVDVILTPATPTPPFKLGAKIDDPLEMYLGDIYTATANLAGIPGLVVPIGDHPNGLPVGMQLLARHFDEEVLFRTGNAVLQMNKAVVE